MKHDARFYLVMFDQLFVIFGNHGVGKCSGRRRTGSIDSVNLRSDM